MKSKRGFRLFFIGVFLLSFAMLMYTQRNKGKRDHFLPIKASEYASLFNKPKVRFTVVNFWATWCEPCVEEFPQIIKAVTEFEKEKKISLIFIDTDFKKEYM